MRNLLFMIVCVSACGNPSSLTDNVAQPGVEVCIEYELKNSSGYRFDGTNQPNGPTPLCFYVGRKEVIPGIDSTVVGMSVGETKNVVLSFDQGFGKTGLFYVTHNRDTIWLSNPNDALLLNLKIIEVNPLLPS